MAGFRSLLAFWMGGGSSGDATSEKSGVERLHLTQVTAKVNDILWDFSEDPVVKQVVPKKDKLLEVFETSDGGAVVIISRAKPVPKAPVVKYPSALEEIQRFVTPTSSEKLRQSVARQAQIARDLALSEKIQLENEEASRAIYEAAAHLLI
jgi:hypothetical protein